MSRENANYERFMSLATALSALLPQSRRLYDTIATGWYLISTEGSHRQYKHPNKPGRVTIPGHLNDDVHPKTLASVFKQAQLKRQLKEELERYYYYEM